MVGPGLGDDEDRGRRAHRDEEELRLVQVRHVATVEQRLLAAVAAVVGQQNALVHEASLKSYCITCWAIQRSIFASSNLSGRLLSLNTALWNSASRNFGPSARAARSRSSWILSEPIL